MKKTLLLLVVLFIVASCAKEDENIKTAKDVSIELSVGDTYVIDGVGTVSTNNIDDFIAKLSGKTITAVHVGSTSAVCASDYGDFKLDVKVNPKNTLYNDLKEHLGKSRTEINNLFGTPIKTNSAGTSTYSPIGKSDEIQVAFVSDRAVIVSITFETKYANELGLHLRDRYEGIVSRVSDGLYADAYKLENAKYVVYAQWNESYIMASYMTKAEYDKITN